VKRLHIHDGPGEAFNITARVNWAVWHLEPETHCRSFLAILDRCATKYGFSVIGYVLMANHCHVIVQSPTDPRYAELTTRETRCRHRRPYPRGHMKASALSQFMHGLMWMTSRRIQRELGIKGHFWEDSYWATQIQDAVHLLIALAYDHNNPVKEKMVERPEDYRRSSAAWWAGTGGAPVDLLAHDLPFGLDLSAFRCSLLRVQGSDDFLPIMADIEEGVVSLEDPTDRLAIVQNLSGSGVLSPVDLRIRNPQPGGVTR